MKFCLIVTTFLIVSSAMAKDSYNSPMYEVKDLDSVGIQVKQANIDGDLEFRVLEDESDGQRGFASDFEQGTKKSKDNSKLKYWKYDASKE